MMATKYLPTLKKTPKTKLNELKRHNIAILSYSLIFLALLAWFKDHSLFIFSLFEQKHFHGSKLYAHVLITFKNRSAFYILGVF